MSKMTPQELIVELNEFAKSSDVQTEDAIVQLYFHYVQMFKEYCGFTPPFEIIDQKGSVKLIAPEFK